MSDRKKIMMTMALALCMAVPYLPVLAENQSETTSEAASKDQAADKTDGQTQEQEASDPSNKKDSDTLETITVTFSANGGAWEDGAKTETLSKEVKTGAASILSVPAVNPSRSGYVFGGWNTKADGSGGTYTASTMTNADLTVYAQWKVDVPEEGRWEQQSGGTYKYRLPNGDYAANMLLTIDGKMYLFNNAGNMVTGFAKWENKTYFFDNSGAMKIGWLQEPKSGSWYYCTREGLKTGWLLDAGKWYYFQNNGKMTTGWVEEDGSWFYCDNSGAMITDRWATIKGYQYYFTSSGAMKTGWFKDPQDGKYYLLSDSGAMCTGWYQDPTTKNWYFLGPDGAMVTGWYTDPETQKTYLLGDDGVMITGWCHNLKTDEWYYFNMQAGYQIKSSWVRSDGKYYYIKPNGVMAVSSWIRSNRDGETVYYYVQTDGSMAVNTTIGGYRFDENGVCTNPNQKSTDN